MSHIRYEIALLLGFFVLVCFGFTHSAMPETRDGCVKHTSSRESTIGNPSCAASSRAHATIVLFATRLVDCQCVASTVDAINTPADCGGIAGNPPIFFVTTLSKVGNTCNVVAGPQCLTVAGRNCTASVKVELQWPSNPCISSGSVTGPGIGTDGSPCQPI
jgi:hypothetical protein